jgi:hypothetical protein
MSGANERLGLPFAGMSKITVAFDVDGTLIRNGGNGDVANARIVDLLKVLSTFKNIKIVVWSGGGRDYAARWVRLLDIEKYVDQVASKTEHETIAADIAIDDIQDTAIGKLNLIVREK